MQTASPLACRSCSTVNGKKKRSRARLFFTRKSEFLYLSISLECVCSSRQRRQSGAVCSLQFSLPQKPPSEKISVYLDPRDRRLKMFFFDRFFLIGPKNRDLFSFSDDRRKKSKEGRENKEFSFFFVRLARESEQQQQQQQQQQHSFFSLFFFSLSRALSRGEKGQHKKKHKKETRFTVDTPARSNERNIDFPVRFHSSASAV